MKASTLSALLVALLATPQSSLGRSIPRGLPKEQRGLFPFIPKLPGGSPSTPDGTPDGGAGGVGRAGAGVGAGSVGVGAPNPGPGAPGPAGNGGLGQYGEPLPAPTRVAAPAPLPTIKHDRPSPGSSDSETAPDPTRPRVGPGPLSPALPGGSNPNPFPNLNPPAAAPATGVRPAVPPVAVNRNRNAPGGVFNLRNHPGYTVTTRNEDFFGNSLEVTINNRIGIPPKRVGLVRIDKAEKSIDVEDVRFSEEKVKGKVVAERDETVDRARGFEVVTSSWTHEAGLDITQLKRLNYDSVEQGDTETIIKRLIPVKGDTPPGSAAGSPSSPRPGTSGSGSETGSRPGTAGSGSNAGSETIEKKTFTRGNPADAAAFNELLNSPLGVIALDIIQFTPIGKQVKSITIGRDSSSPKTNPSFEILFE